MSKYSKAAFNDFFDSTVSTLESQYINCGLYFQAEMLTERHWKQLWKIFRGYTDECLSLGTKDQAEVLDEAVDKAGAVILDAHDINYDALDESTQMDYYLNSGKYP